MPRARPSTTTRSSISWRGYIFTLPQADLPLQRLVGAEQELLAGLAAGVEGARDLRAAEGAVGEQAAVLAGERHALGHALVDDVHADLGQAVDVGLAGAEVAALDGVVEEAVDAVAVVLVVLGGVDAALGGDRVGAARAVLVAEALDVVAELGQRWPRPTPPARPEPTTMTLYFRLLAGLTSFISKRCLSHFFSIGPAGTLASQLHGCSTRRLARRGAHEPARTASGNEMLPTTTTTVTRVAKACRRRL